MTTPKEKVKLQTKLFWAGEDSVLKVLVKIQGLLSRIYNRIYNGVQMPGGAAPRDPTHSQVHNRLYTDN